jgi:hypothetical protein
MLMELLMMVNGSTIVKKAKVLLSMSMVPSTRVIGCLIRFVPLLHALDF